MKGNKHSRLPAASAILLVTAIVLTAFTWGLTTGINRGEQMECKRWQDEAKKIAPYSDENPGGYYLTKWQKEQCDHWHIEVEAPVR